jgi:hypothetical protein
MKNLKYNKNESSQIDNIDNIVVRYEICKYVTYLIGNILSEQNKNIFKIAINAYDKKNNL